MSGSFLFFSFNLLRVFGVDFSFFFFFFPFLPSFWGPCVDIFFSFSCAWGAAFFLCLWSWVFFLLNVHFAFSLSPSLTWTSRPKFIPMILGRFFNRVEQARCRELREALTTFFSSGTKRLLIFFFTFTFSIRREKRFLLCWPFHLTQQTRGESRRPQLDWSRPGSKIN